jgi:hypothetical protein
MPKYTVKFIYSKDDYNSLIEVNMIKRISNDAYLTRIVTTAKPSYPTLEELLSAVSRLHDSKYSKSFLVKLVYNMLRPNSSDPRFILSTATYIVKSFFDPDYKVEIHYV